MGTVSDIFGRASQGERNCQAAWKPKNGLQHLGTPCILQGSPRFRAVALLSKYVVDAILSNHSLQFSTPRMSSITVITLYYIENDNHHLYSRPMVDETPTFVSKHRILSQLNRYQGGNRPPGLCWKGLWPFHAFDGRLHGLRRRQSWQGSGRVGWPTWKLMGNQRSKGIPGYTLIFPTNRTWTWMQLAIDAKKYSHQT